MHIKVLEKNMRENPSDFGIWPRYISQGAEVIPYKKKVIDKLDFFKRKEMYYLNIVTNNKGSQQIEKIFTYRYMTIDLYPEYIKETSYLL